MKNIILSFLAILIGVAVYAQVPQAISYQAVAHDTNGNVLLNHKVSFKISILSGSINGTVVYSEVHTGKATNESGLVDLEIGRGMTGYNFSAINWGGNTFFVMVEMDPKGGTTYEHLGTSQLLSVPYAMTAAYGTDKAAKALADKLLSLLYKSGTLVADADGYNYRTVQIGNQLWFAENLRTTRYNDGTSIPNVTDNGAWAALTTGGYCWNANDRATFGETYGALYNWYAVNTGKLCPAGWRVSSDFDWVVLAYTLGGEIWTVAGVGSMLKETGTTHWTSPNLGATNYSGFTALPGGSRNINGDPFLTVGTHGMWWTSTESSSGTAWSWYLGFAYTDVYQWGDYLKGNGLSIRCVRDI